jgi:WhiB family transcriptional regulator, redox-sensing transcriptional regulator
MRGMSNEFDLRQGSCRDEDPELFFPVGTSGPALLQTEQAKAVCRHCPVAEACLRWALESGQGEGVWGGASEPERRVALREYGLEGAIANLAIGYGNAPSVAPATIDPAIVAQNNQGGGSRALRTITRLQ